MIKDFVGKFYDYSISPEIRQVLFRWGYKLTEKYFFTNSTNQLKKIFSFNIKHELPSVQ